MGGELTDSQQWDERRKSRLCVWGGICVCVEELQ